MIHKEADIIDYCNDPVKLQEIKTCLILEKARRDKEFSKFLEETNLDADNMQDENWNVYNRLSTEYYKIDSLLKLTEYYLGR